MALMRISSIFGQQNKMQTREEPVVTRVLTQAGPMENPQASEDAWSFESFECGNSIPEAASPYACQSVFDLLGEDRLGFPNTMTGVDPDDLITVFQRRYFEVLMSPHGTDFGFDHGLPMSNDAGASHADVQPGADGNGDLQISGLLSGPQRLEDAIGRLESGTNFPDEFGMSVPAVPEILQLFAPPEYQVGAAARRHTVPPLLARREHHALAIDSPLPAFGVATCHLHADLHVPVE
jgi:hypothetical protein